MLAPLFVADDLAGPARHRKTNLRPSTRRVLVSTKEESK
jgi:hypothetical protein